MNSSSQSQPCAARDHSLAGPEAEPSAALSRSEILERLRDETLTLAEYMPFARAALRSMFGGA